MIVRCRISTKQYDSTRISKLPTKIARTLGFTQINIRRRFLTWNVPYGLIQMTVTLAIIVHGFGRPVATPIYEMGQKPFYIPSPQSSLVDKRFKFPCEKPRPRRSAENLIFDTSPAPRDYVASFGLQSARNPTRPPVAGFRR